MFDEMLHEMISRNAYQLRPQFRQRHREIEAEIEELAADDGMPYDGSDYDCSVVSSLADEELRKRIQAEFYDEFARDGTPRAITIHDF